jgi:hypothetical protein
MSAVLRLYGHDVSLKDGVFECKTCEDLADSLNTWSSLTPKSPAYGDPENVLIQDILKDWPAELISHTQPETEENDVIY